MNIKALLFAIAGAVVALFYALESILEFQAGGLAAPLFAKILICLIGIYACFRYGSRVRKGKAES
jgi:hypothetical protein